MHGRNSISALACALLVTLAALMLALGHQQAVGAIQMAEAADQRAEPAAASLAVVENPEITARVLESLLRSVVYSTSASELQPFSNGAQKRGLDLGISRGFSGSQAGKHLMGLSAASFANGPGKR